MSLGSLWIAGARCPDPSHNHERRRRKRRRRRPTCSANESSAPAFGDLLQLHEDPNEALQEELVHLVRRWVSNVFAPSSDARSP